MDSNPHNTPNNAQSAGDTNGTTHTPREVARNSGREQENTDVTNTQMNTPVQNLPSTAPTGNTSVENLAGATTGQGQGMQTSAPTPVYGHYAYASYHTVNAQPQVQNTMGSTPMQQYP